MLSVHVNLPKPAESGTAVQGAAVAGRCGTASWLLSSLTAPMHSIFIATLAGFKRSRPWGIVLLQQRFRLLVEMQQVRGIVHSTQLEASAAFNCIQQLVVDLLRSAVGWQLEQVHACGGSGQAIDRLLIHHAAR